MPSKKAQIKKAAGKKPTVNPTATDMYAALKAKFAELKAIREKINELKGLYQKQDALVEELMPLFVEKTDSMFIIKRQIVLGTEVHTLIPFFYDMEKGKLLSKKWKSTPMETMAIE